MGITKPIIGPILNHVEEGVGPPVLLIHGLANSLRDWDTVVPDLLTAGFCVCRVDLFGHGSSPNPGSPRLYNFKVVYGTLEEWIDSIWEEGEPLSLVGHSMGGYMSLMYTLRHPARVRALTLIDPLYSLKQLPPFMINTYRLSSIGTEMLRLAPSKLVDIALGRGPTLDLDFSPVMRRRIVADVKRASPYILNIPGTLPELEDELYKIDVPSQVIWGERDGLLNPDSFPPMVSAMPYAIGHMIPARGHQPHLENPRVNQMILEFINTALISEEEMHAFFGVDSERLAWAEMILEKYQTSLGIETPSVMEAVVDAEIPAVQEPISLEEKKALLMNRFEAQLDELLTWHEESPDTTSEQFDKALEELKKQMNDEITSILLDGGGTDSK